MLHDVNAEDVRTTHRESITDRFTSCEPSVPRPSVHLYTLLPTNELYMI